MQFKTIILVAALLSVSTVLALPGSAFSTPQTAPQATPVAATPAPRVNPMTKTPLPIKALSLASSSTGGIYTFTKKATLAITEKVSGVFYAAGTVLNFASDRIPVKFGQWLYGADEAVPNPVANAVYKGLLKAGAVVASKPLYYASLPMYMVGSLLMAANFKADEVFDRAEEYADYVKYINTAMGPIFEVANGKPVNMAIAQVRNALETDATPKLIEATRLWIEAHPNSSSASYFKTMLKQVEEKQTAFNKGVKEAIDAATVNENAAAAASVAAPQ